MLDSRVCFCVRPVPFGSFELTPLILTCFPSTVSGTGGFPCLRGERGSQFVDTARVICGAGSTKLSSVRPSVCLSVPSRHSAAARRCGGFAAVGRGKF